MFVNEQVVDGAYSKLSTLKALPDDLATDISGIKNLMSDKACGDMNSAISNITSLTETTSFLKNILNTTSGLLSFLEGIAGIRNGIKGGTSQCFSAVNTAIGNQMNIFMGQSPTRRRLLLIPSVVDNAVGNNTLDLSSSATNAVENVLDDNTAFNTFHNITGVVNNVLGNSSLQNLLSNVTGMVDHAFGNIAVTSILSNITRMVTGNHSFFHILHHWLTCQFAMLLFPNTQDILID